ncbi:hypothetical protein ABPG72_003887 [Tetrahymena utriculariae]
MEIKEQKNLNKPFQTEDQVSQSKIDEIKRKILFKKNLEISLLKFLTGDIKSCNKRVNDERRIQIVIGGRIQCIIRNGFTPKGYRKVIDQDQEDKYFDDEEENEVDPSNSEYKGIEDY